MDSQLKRGILETCVLAVLAKGDSYGYQIGADMAAVIEISESTLYSILKRLKRRGYASAHSVEGAGHLRVYYSMPAILFAVYLFCAIISSLLSFPSAW